MNTTIQNYEEILAKIPEYFWGCFAGELVGVFGIDIYVKDSEGERILDFVSCTAGWNAALRMTCEKLDMDWFMTWYDELDWMESDHVDGELVDLLIEKVIDAKSDNAVPYYKIYYQWLADRYYK